MESKIFSTRNLYNDELQNDTVYKIQYKKRHCVLCNKYCGFESFMDEIKSYCLKF